MEHGECFAKHCENDEGCYAIEVNEGGNCNTFKYDPKGGLTGSQWNSRSYKATCITKDELVTYGFTCCTSGSDRDGEDCQAHNADGSLA